MKKLIAWLKLRSYDRRVDRRITARVAITATLGDSSFHCDCPLGDAQAFFHMFLTAVKEKPINEKAD